MNVDGPAISAGVIQIECDCINSCIHNGGGATATAIATPTVVFSEWAVVGRRNSVSRSEASARSSALVELALLIGSDLCKLVDISSLENGIEYLGSRLNEMSINWVMTHPRDGFVRLPKEDILWKSSPRTSFSLSTPRAYPGTNPLSIKSDNGTIYLTNQRIVYLPATPTDSFKSFSASHLNLHDSHLVLPWFGPNAWQALVEPVPGGNIPNNHHVELKFTFKDGGAPDFNVKFEGIKERLHQAVENARQLPSYEDSGHDRVVPPPSTSSAQPPRQSSEVISPSLVSRSVDEPPVSRPADESQAAAQPRSSQAERPSEAPPGYEETQQHGLESALAQRFNTGQT
ncbi:hypothetical protein DV735_g1018, partial [Chaetothyriales sp. CBS 134920]